MTAKSQAPLCPECGQNCTPTSVQDEDAAQFPWTCEACGILCIDDSDYFNQSIPQQDFETEQLATIYDKNGESYEVSAIGDPQWYLVSVRRDRGKIGQVNLCWTEPPVMELADLIIESAYRNKGIGTALMPVIYAIAQSRGLDLIQGSVTHKDVQVTPYLLAWYRQLGFNVQMIPGNKDWIAWISRSI